MKEVFIISTGLIVKGKTAGSQRVMNIAKSLAAGGVNVFLVSLYQINKSQIDSFELYPGIYHLKSRNNQVKSFLHLLVFLRSMNRFMKERNSETVIYLYPTVFIRKDFAYLLYFKLLKGFKLYCDINELRVTNVFTLTPPVRFLSKLVFYLRSVYDYIAYKLSEIQVLFYDGIVVISSNLEKYFSGNARKIIKVPILCDVTRILEERPAIQLDDTVFKICFAGFINCKKEGFDILFEALCEVNLKKNVELFLYGMLPDDDKYVLDRLTETFKLHKKVFYMGNIEPDNLSLEFLKYHLLILPRPVTRQTKFGFSTKLSEYLVSGVPVLITDVSDNAIYIKDNYNGFIIPPGSAHLMVNKIMEIIKNYNKNSATIAGNAFRTVRENFDYNLYTKTFINFLFNN